MKILIGTTIDNNKEYARLVCVSKSDGSMIYEKKQPNQTNEEFKNYVDDFLMNLGVTHTDFTNGTVKVLDIQDQEIGQFFNEYNNDLEGIINDRLDEEDDLKIIKNLTMGATAAVFIVGCALIAKSTYEFTKNNNPFSQKDEAIETEETTAIEPEENTYNTYGFYGYDISEYDWDEYLNNLPPGAQKENAINYLSIGNGFNSIITMTDGTKNLGGVTPRQLMAIDVYANSNIYTPEDYIENFGLIDLNSLYNDMSLGIFGISAHLTNKEVDGTILADIFKDEVVKENYLEQYKLFKNIVNATDKKTKTAAINAFEKFIDETGNLTTSDKYIDYSEHPGMYIVTSSMHMALQYEDITFEDMVIEKLILGNDSIKMSNLHTICQNVITKYDSAQKLIDKVTLYLEENQDYIDSLPEGVTLENDLNQSFQIYKEILGKMCDPEQLIDLIDRTFEVKEILVTKEDQGKATQNQIQRQQQIHNENFQKNDPYANGKTQDKKETGVPLTDEQTNDLKKTQPEDVTQAQQVYSSKEGLAENEEEAAARLAEEAKNEKNKAIALLEQIYAYYKISGYKDNGAIPAELQNACEILGYEKFNAAREHGYGLYSEDHPIYIGGDDVIYSEYDDVNLNPPVVVPDSTNPVAKDQATVGDSTTPSDANNDALTDYSDIDVEADKTQDQGVGSNPGVSSQTTSQANLQILTDEQIEEFINSLNSDELASLTNESTYEDELGKTK